MLTELFTKLTEVAGGNQLVAGAISMWGLGTLTYICRFVPSLIFQFLKKHLTTKVTITSNHQAFYKILQWFDDSGQSKKFRSLKLSNGMYGDDKDSTKTVGYGTHLFWFQKRPMLVSLSKTDATISNMRDKEDLVIGKLGRSHKIVDQLIEEALVSKEDTDYTSVYKHRRGWMFVGKQPNRQFSTVFWEEKSKQQLLDCLDQFLKKESWYKKTGIPYQLGILLYGPPGTGKTSLIKATAAFLNREVRIIPPQSMDELDSAFSDIDAKKSIFVIEDVDSCSFTQRRDSEDDLEDASFPVNQPVQTKNKNYDGFFEGILGAGISEVLNALDGIVSTHGRVLFMTTNHIEKLDEAILRPGRVDLRLEMGYVTEEVFRQFMLSFYQTCPESFRMKNKNLTVAMLQEMVLRGQTADQVIQECINPVPSVKTDLSHELSIQ